MWFREHEYDVQLPCLIESLEYYLQQTDLKLYQYYQHFNWTYHIITPVATHAYVL